MNVIFSKIWLGVLQAWLQQMIFGLFGLSRMSSTELPDGKMLPCAHCVGVFCVRAGDACWNIFGLRSRISPILCHTSASTRWYQLHVSSPPLIPAEIDETVTSALASRAACLQKVRNINVTYGILQTLTVMKPLCSPHCFCVWCSVLETLQEFSEKVSNKENLLCAARSAEPWEFEKCFVNLWQSTIHPLMSCSQVGPSSKDGSQ